MRVASKNNCCWAASKNLGLQYREQKVQNPCCDPFGLQQGFCFLQIFSPRCILLLLLCIASPNIPRHAPVRNARPRPLAVGGLASLEPRRRFRRHPPQRALPVARCRVWRPVRRSGVWWWSGPSALAKLDLSAQMHGFPNTSVGVSARPCMLLSAF